MLKPVHIAQFLCVEAMRIGKPHVTVEYLYLLILSRIPIIRVNRIRPRTVYKLNYFVKQRDCIERKFACPSTVKERLQNGIQSVGPVVITSKWG